ncbi:hypothetical protein [Snodgrassella alvi]|uniref:hypothetical protein n=2 Tax=Snodgrassella alvi TaxID=1196083 RepID=UPI0034E88944
MRVNRIIKSNLSLIKPLIMCAILSLNCNYVMAQEASSEMTPQARIRLYGQNQKPTNMRYRYEGHLVKETAGGNLSGAFTSLLRIARNSSIGIPATSTIETMKQHNHYLSKLFYREFTIPANIPITISNAYMGLTTVNDTHQNGSVIYNEPSCQSNKLTFVAKPGHDYEAIASSASAQCGVTLLEVHADGSTTPLVNVQAGGN